MICMSGQPGKVSWEDPAKNSWVYKLKKSSNILERNPQFLQKIQNVQVFFKMLAKLGMFPVPKTQLTILQRETTSNNSDISCWRRFSSEGVSSSILYLFHPKIPRHGIWQIWLQGAHTFCGPLIGEFFPEVSLWFFQTKRRSVSIRFLNNPQRGCAPHGPQLARFHRFWGVSGSWIFCSFHTATRSHMSFRALCGKERLGKWPCCNPSRTL